MATASPPPPASASGEEAELRSLLLSSSSPHRIPSACIAVHRFLHGLPPEHSRDFYSFCFPVLLQKIFGFQDCHSFPPSAASPSAHSGGWLSLVSSPPNDAAVKALISLLSPSGVLFSSLLQVGKESAVRFVFPTERLPDWVQRLLSLEKGALILSQVSKLFKDRIKLGAGGSLQVQLDVFEYFVFWFAYYAVCKDNSFQQSTFLSKKDHSFFRSMWESSLQDWLHHLSHNAISNRPLDPYLQLLHLYLVHFVPPTRSNSSLSRLPYAELSPANSSRADFLVHTLVEFWLIDDDPSPVPWPLRQSLGFPTTGSAVATCVLPSSELTDALRVFVDHINKQWAVSFVGSSTASVPGALLTSPSVHFDSSPAVPGFSHSTYVRLLQRPLYRFILRAFRLWTAGSPVRKASCIVDVWSDYLQPWGTPPRGGRAEQQISESKPGKGSMQSAISFGFSERWQSFVTANFLFYSSLVFHFLEFALKFMHLDPEAMLQMTSKILNVLAGSSDLVDCLQKVDAIYNSSHSGMLQQSNNVVSAIQEQLQDWEESLHADCNRDSDVLHPLSLQSRTPRLGFFSKSEGGGQHVLQMLILQAEGEIQLLSYATRISCTKPLEAIKKAGQVIFDSRAISSPAVTPLIEAQSIACPVVSSRAFPQHTWLDVRYRGDWMRRPIESTEIAWLVRYLVRLSDHINASLDLISNCEAQEGRHQPQETGNVNTVRRQISTETGHAQYLHRLQDSKYLSMLLSFIWNSWLLLHLHLRRRGWRVNLRFMAKKPILFFAILIVAYMFRNLIFILLLFLLI